MELSVSDLDRSVAWYCELLGARDVFRGADEHEGITDCAIFEPKSKMVFAFTCHKEQEGAPFTPRRVGLDHVAFGVTTREGLEEWLARLTELGIANSCIRDYGYADAITFSDPDGIALELFWSKRG